VSDLSRARHDREKVDARGRAILALRFGQPLQIATIPQRIAILRATTSNAALSFRERCAVEDDS
jgi:hypothetical protein